jgi:hypothetical protein
MGRILTNNTALAAAAETSVGVAGTSWFLLEPNDIGTFGASLSTVAREPISKDRARRKGTIVDLESAVEFEADLTMSSAFDFSEAFLFATASQADLRFAAPDATGTGYTVAALDATQAGKLQYAATGLASLLKVRGFALAANNGLKALGGAATALDTELTVSGLSAETAPAKALLELAGVRCESDDLALTVTGTTAVLTSGGGAGAAVDFSALGLMAGQMIHVGGLTSATQFAAGAGYARVTAVAAGQLSLDKLDAALVTDAGTGQAVDLLFGQFLRNVSTDHADFLERSYTFELAMPNLDSGGATMYEYALGNYANELTFNVPLAEKATMSFGFIGTDTNVPVAAGSRKSGAADAPVPNATEAVNTSADVLRLRVADVDDNAMTSCFKDFSLTLNNNVSPEKCIGTLGAEFMNTGNFMVDLEAEVLFTDADVADAIRNNTTVTMDLVLRNNDGAIALDIPSMTLGDGAKSFPVNESVTMALSGMAFNDPTLGNSLGMSTFPAAPAA